MNLQQLEYFKVIAETKNFTTASNILSVTQPALSKAISKLEEELEVSLFEREGRNIKITKFGEVFLKYADSALKEIERGKERLQDMKRNNDRVISIASTHCIGATFIPFLISNFFNNKLQVKFNINNQSTEEILKDLKYGRVDFGFFDNMKDIENYPEIESILVKNEEYVLIVPKNHHLANKEEIYLNDLKDEYFIVYKDKSYEEKISYSEFIDYTPKIVAEPDEGSVLAGLVSAGAGIAIVLNTPIMNNNKISVLKIKDNIGYKSIYMGWNKELYTSEIKKEFKEYVVKLG
ncbi:bacterial regulatory helix-turn-helix, lysR family protein [Clostridium baratii str. Sullivan]|uniref:Bacterial regulatory helix-turn-helix, lysR family protein n=1 Tax=Clostridium baratii str. Sullivan TaxID=1415775 RepID=A0A0A7FWP5_9CLOT|nr:LysR family transcriptional regulator [Clostridium baratii]AIY84069.1 bacterial regulatory helix-turn-helix, lysR family protein [Clostridium baratii str. Sullivan]